MRTIKFNGEFWYEDNNPLWKRIAVWCIWIGGMTTWDRSRGERVWRGTFRKLADLAPVALFGHRVTFYSWGASVRIGGDHLCITWRSGCPSGSALPYAYISRDGTPTNAHTWLLNPPSALKRAAEQRAPGPVYEVYS